MTKILAHRGSSGTHPENTLVAFKEAEKVGADGIEFDVHYTKDNQLVVIHDNTVNRTTNGKGVVRELTLSELQSLDAGSFFSESFQGERIPTLEETLDWAQHTDLVINIELKYNALDYAFYEESILQEIAKRQLEDQVIISSFNHYAIKKISKLNPNLNSSILYMERLFEPWNYASTSGATAIHPYMHGIDKELIKQAKQNNCPVRVFTVNKKEHIASFIQAGCSAIITDYPERALQIRQKLLDK